MSLTNVVSGQVHGQQLQGVQTAPQGLNNQAVRLGTGQKIREGLSETFSNIGTFFKRIGDRIKAHHEHNVEKVRTSIANRGAQKALGALTGSPVSERKALSGLKTLMEKAIKLDPQNPKDKAVALLSAKIGNLTPEQKNELFSNNFAQLKSLMTAMGTLARDQGNHLVDILHDTGMVTGEVVHQTGPSQTETLTGQLLDHLSDLGKQHFAQTLNDINGALDSYFTNGNITAETMYRSDAPVTKAMAKHLGVVNAQGLENLKNQTIDVAKRTAKLTGELELGNYGKIDLTKLSTEQFDAILDGASQLMESMMGGSTVDGANTAALNLSPNIVRLMQTQNNQVSNHLANNATANETAFTGTLFLRSLTSSIVSAQTGQKEQETAIMKIFSQVVTYALNQTSDVSNKMGDLSGENQTKLQAFIDGYAAPLATFRATVLGRTDV